MITLHLHRHSYRDKYVIGKLTAHDYTKSPAVGFSCDTLEPNICPERPKGHIPAGTYRITRSWSPKFQKTLFHLNDVKGFTRILIHSGNTVLDTLGCILVGKNNQVGSVNSSRSTYAQLESFLNHTNNIQIIIT